MTSKSTFDYRVKPSSPSVFCHKFTRQLVVHRLNVFWTSLTRILMGRDEMQIRQQQDGSGQMWWCVYDPVSDRSVCFSSEAAAYDCLDSDQNVL
jgi:hypothetical protein